MRQRAAPRSLSCRLDAGVGCSCESSIGPHTHPDGGSPAIDERHVDELYGLPPEEFVTRRDALARELRSTDRGASAEIKALRRPTVGAWLVNQLARAEADALDELLETGAALRDTQAAVVAGQAEGAALQQLSSTRRGQLDGLLAAAARLGAAEGRRGVPLEAVEATLVAATADEGAAAAVRSGRLVKELSYSGFGLSDDPADVVATPLRVVRRPAAGIDRPPARAGRLRIEEEPDRPAGTPRGGATTGPGRAGGPARRGTGKQAAAPPDPRRSAAEATAARALRDAQAAVQDACGDADDKQRAYEAVATELSRRDDELTRLAAELDQARTAAAEARERHNAARAAAKAAHAEAERRRVALTKAQLKVDRLRGE